MTGLLEGIYILKTIFSPQGTEYEARGRKKQCGNKVKYKTQKKAGDGLVRHHGLNNDFNTYLCPYCEYWHVGHKINNERK